MRLKKHLKERIASCNDILLAREGDEYFSLTEEEKLAYRIYPEQVFGNDHPLLLEIGCGKGAWAIGTALKRPQCNIFAVEKLSNVIVVACEQAQQLHLPNLRFLNVRAENLDRYLPPRSVAEIHLNFSCPFPKKTYANRRLTSKNYLAIYRQLLAEGGIVRLKTDNRDFFEWSLDSLQQHGFALTDVCRDLPERDDDIVTEYEAKFRAQGMAIYSFTARVIR